MPKALEGFGLIDCRYSCSLSEAKGRHGGRLRLALLKEPPTSRDHRGQSLDLPCLLLPPAPPNLPSNSQRGTAEIGCSERGLKSTCSKTSAKYSLREGGACDVPRPTQAQVATQQKTQGPIGY